MAPFFNFAWMRSLWRYRVLRVRGLYATAATLIVCGAVSGLVNAGKIVGLNAYSKLAAALLGPFAPLMWAMSEPDRSDHTGRYMFALFSIIMLPLLGIASSESSLTPVRSLVSVGVWIAMGLLTFGLAHFVD